ncbi:MAG: translocation/assembly module TamB domain-containing protein [Bacteroidales bacterium]|nr:translocation/assembly module TamB domain-containing protein [Bacteroidales bacterium]
MILLLLGGGLIALQLPGVQARLSRIILERLEEKLQGHITFSELGVTPRGSFVIKDLLVLDDHPYTADTFQRGWAPVDTIFTARSVSGTAAWGSLLRKKGIHLRRVEIDGPDLHLVREPFQGRMQTNLQRFTGHKKKPYVPGRKVPTPDLFTIDRVHLSNLHFRLTSFMPEKHPYAGSGICWDRVDVRGEVRGHALRYTGGRMSGVADLVRVREQSGFELVRLTGRAQAGMGKTTIEHIHLVDPWTDLNVPRLTMSYLDQRHFNRFVEHVRLEGKIDRSTLAERTLAYFAPGVHGNSVFDIRGAELDGYINDFSVRKLICTDVQSGVDLDLQGSLTGLTQGRELLTDLKVNNLSFSTEGAKNLLSRLGVKGDPLARVARGRQFSFSGSAAGPLNRLHAHGSLYALHTGRATANLDIRNLTDRKRGTEITGTLATRDLDISALTGVKAAGPCTANTGLRAILDGKSSSIIVDSLFVDRLRLLDYDYTGIAAAGKYSENAFDGKIICADPNLNFIFQGIFNLSRKTSNALYKFYANLGYADLQALGLDKRGGTSKVSCQVSSNFMRIGRGDLIGDVDIADIILEDRAGRHEIGDISVGSHSNNDVHRIQFNSLFADAGYVGRRSPAALWAELQRLTTRRELPALYAADNPDRSEAGGAYELSLRVHDTRDLLSFVLPGLYIADSTRFDLGVERDGSVRGRLTSPRLAYGTQYLKGVDLTLDNLERSLNGTLTSSEMNLADIGFRNSALTAFAQDNGFFLGFHYDNIRGIDNVGEIYLSGELARDATDTLIVSARPLSSYVRFNGNQWTLDEADIRYRAGEVQVRDFAIKNGPQRISLDGGVSLHGADTLALSINGVDMDVVNYFTRKDLDIRGRSSGRALLISPMRGSMHALMNLGCDSLSVSGQQAGSLRAAGVWDSRDGKINAYLRSISDGRDALSARGTYDLESRSLTAHSVFDGMNLILARPFLPDAISDLSGRLNGRIEASGPLDSLSLSGQDLRLQDAALTVAFTQVPYVLNGPIRLDDTGLYFDGMTVSDRSGGSALLTGGLLFDRLQNLRLDASASLSDLELADIPESPDFYGHLFARGDLRITGPLKALTLDANIATAKSGSLHIPLGGGTASASGDLLTFTDHSVVYEDPYETMIGALKAQGRKDSAGDFTARARIAATPDLETFVEIGGNGENVLSARGTGLITVDLHPSKRVFNLGGDYSISDGRYHFELPGIAKKDLAITSGSSIKFSGDILESQLDIDAAYTLKTSLSRLISDTTSVSSRRLVECGISITDRLRAPKLGFRIDVPDLDPTTKSQVESALNTEDKLQKQFIALLITGSFLPSETSGIVNNTGSMLFSNVSEIMTGQLNNILQRLDIPLDLGLAYQQNDTGNDIFDVAVSTQLFNDRVIVNGSVGNRQNRASTTEGDMVGDLDIDVKLDRPGQFRLNLFSHSADEYSSFLDYSQRNGAGITYQKEFNRWSEFLRDLFSSRKKRTERALRDLEREKQETVLEIAER